MYKIKNKAGFCALSETRHLHREQTRIHLSSGVDILFLLFPPSGVPLGFQTF